MHICACLCLCSQYSNPPFSGNVEPGSTDFGKGEHRWWLVSSSLSKAIIPMQSPFSFPPGPSVWFQCAMLIQKAMLSCYSFHFIFVTKKWEKSQLLAWFERQWAFTALTRAWWVQQMFRTFENLTFFSFTLCVCKSTEQLIRSHFKQAILTAKPCNFRGTVPWFISNALTNFTGKSKIKFLQPQVNKLIF